jgi:hypothetical protein
MAAWTRALGKFAEFEPISIDSGFPNQMSANHNWDPFENDDE